MTKKTIYTIFLAKFVFSLALIFWTIKITMGAGVGLDDDNSFFSNYKDIDTQYNNIMNNNINFNNKYNTNIKINNTAINELSFNDIYLSQRVIQNRKINKNILNVNKNKISIIIRDKITNKIIKDIDVKIKFTRPSTHDDNLNISLQNSNKNINFIINKKAYWNIMGIIKINDDEGQFFIKTNSK